MNYNFWEKPLILPENLQEIVESKFVFDNDGITLKTIDHCSNPKFDTNLQQCEWEDFENHFHPDAFIETDNEMEYLQLALECGKRIAKRLEAALPNRSFRVTIAFSETKIKDHEIEFYGSSTVRFYQIRQDCDHIMRTKDLNDFKFDAVLEMEKI